MNKKPFEVEIEVAIKTYDIDFAGIVSNIVYIRWLEDLRLKMLELYCPLEELIAKGYCPIVNSTAIKYQKALRLGNHAVGRMWMSQLGRLRCTLEAEIYLGQEIAATATQVGFFIDLETMRPRAIPEEFKHIYNRHN
ncbi:hypothetical protein NIES4102_12970 [Chondrocystis sp. NIES-4102]|nr:hypothetical protein NIES4102_12970 [Chondrocystis sp. NIES-4102]